MSTTRVILNVQSQINRFDGCTKMTSANVRYGAGTEQVRYRGLYGTGPYRTVRTGRHRTVPNRYGTSVQRYFVSQLLYCKLVKKTGHIYGTVPYDPVRATAQLDFEKSREKSPGRLIL